MTERRAAAMRMIPKRPRDTGSHAEKRMFEPLAGARPGHGTEARIRAALGD